MESIQAETELKETEIGLMPVDWVAIRLRDYIDLETGKRMKGGALLQGEVPSIGGEHIDEWGRINWKDMKFISSDFYDTLKQGKVKVNDVLIVKDGALTGKVAIARRPLPEKCAVNEHVFIVRCKRTDRILSEFLFFYLFSSMGQKQIRVNFHGLIGGIKREDILAIRVPLPSLHEQQKIAFVLSKIQQAIQQQDKIIEATKNLKKSLMQKLFTEGTRGEEQKETEIGLIPKSWDVTELGNVAIQRKELVLPRGHNDVPYIGLEHIDPWNVNITRFGGSDEVKSSKYKFYKNDILYGKLRPYLDKAALASFGGLCSTDIIVIKTSERITPLFLVNLLHLRRFVNYATSTMTGVNHPRTSWTALSKFKLPLPPLHEQQEIANTLSLIDRKIEIEEKREITLQQLFKTMLNKLMTGEIRVKDLDLGVINVS